MEQALLQMQPAAQAKNLSGVMLTAELSLRRGRVHEVTGAAADSFAVVVGAKVSGPIVWIGLARDVGTLTPIALRAFIDPSRVLLTEGANRKEVLWAAEQVLRCKGAALVVIQLRLGPDLHESRRLQLAAEQGGCLGLILIERRAQASAAQTRWECQPQKTIKAANDGALSERWSWTLTKNKSGPVGRWSVSYKGGKDAQTHNVHMVAWAAA